jgi:nuclear-control-of-ATPase protein 2
MPSDNENRIRSSPSPTRHHSPIENSDQNEVGPNLMDGHEATARSRTAERRRNLLDLADKLDQYIHQATEYHVEHTQEVLYAYRMPGHFARHWVKYAAGSIAAIFTARYIYQHSNEVSLWISTTTDAATRFYHNNVEKPLLNMYSVIRYDTHQQLLDPVSLDSSVHSLQNMMTDYAMEHYRLSPEQIDHVRVQAQRGDLSLIMKEYEHEIKRPIRNVMFGDMARLMLVQLQKQKVDLERTLIAMDRLLRSNEINFELIALIPAVLVTLVMAYNVLTFQRVQDRQLFSHMQTLLLAIEKILNANNTRTREALSDESHGLVYLHTYRLRQLMQHKHHLLNVDAERYDFYDDLDEVDSEDLEIQQRLSTVQRMFRHYQFLTVKTKIDK